MEDKNILRAYKITVTETKSGEEVFSEEADCIICAVHCLNGKNKGGNFAACTDEVIMQTVASVLSAAKNLTQVVKQEDKNINDNLISKLKN